MALWARSALLFKGLFTKRAKKPRAAERNLLSLLCHEGSLWLFVVWRTPLGSAAFSKHNDGDRSSRNPPEKVFTITLEVNHLLKNGGASFWMRKKTLEQMVGRRFVNQTIQNVGFLISKWFTGSLASKWSVQTWVWTRLAHYSMEPEPFEDVYVLVVPRWICLKGIFPAVS